MPSQTTLPSADAATPASPSIPETATVSTTASSPQTLSKFKRGRTDISLQNSRTEEFGPSGGVFHYVGQLIRYGRWRKRNRQQSQDDGRNVRARHSSPPRLPELALDEQKIELPTVQAFDQSSQNQLAATEKS